jgi:hypothetical protein
MQQASDPVPSAEHLFREDVAGAQFVAGEDRGYWRLVGIAWPMATIEISASPRAGAPDRYALRFDLTGYPEAPTAQFWDLQADSPLPPARWPGGGLRQSQAFNPGWRTDALYLPVDRLALQGHEVWLTQHATYVWDSACDITQYLRLVYELLNEEGYVGVRGA